jgi:hypothetical protein
MSNIGRFIPVFLSCCILFLFNGCDIRIMQFNILATIIMFFIYYILLFSLYILDFTCSVTCYQHNVFLIIHGCFSLKYRSVVVIRRAGPYRAVLLSCEWYNFDIEQNNQERYSINWLWCEKIYGIRCDKLVSDIHNTTVIL